jgi:hypothetical protein
VRLGSGEIALGIHEFDALIVVTGAIERCVFSRSRARYKQ